MVNQKGQVLLVFSGIFVVVLGLVSLVVDGGWFMWRYTELQAELDAACLAGATGTGYGDFVNSLTSNDVDAEFYTPYEYEQRGLYVLPDGYKAWLTGPHVTYLIQFMGIESVTVSVSTRCREPLARVLPIAVQEPWVLDGFGSSIPYPILGDGAECVDCQGADFAGAVIPQVWCSNTNCDPRMYFSPAEESNSPNVFKSLYKDTIQGTIGSPLVQIGGRVPQISGVSNQFLVKALVDAGYEPGDQIIVMVYDGTIDQPEPGYGNWENLEVIYYALATIVEFDANTLFVTFDEKLETLGDVLVLSRSRTIPYDWSN